MPRDVLFSQDKRISVTEASANLIQRGKLRCLFWLLKRGATGNKIAEIHTHGHQSIQTLAGLYVHAECEGVLSDAMLYTYALLILTALTCD